MRKIKSYFEKYINAENILKLNMTDVQKVFLQETDYEEDFNFIRTEMPELLDSFKITDNWIDKHGTYKQIIENHFIIGNQTKNGIILAGEIKFKEDGTPLFGKYSETGSFFRLDNLIINKNKVYKGTIPDSEVNIKRDYPEENSFILQTLEKNPLEFRLKQTTRYDSIKKYGYEILLLNLKDEKNNKELEIDISEIDLKKLNSKLIISNDYDNSLSDKHLRDEKIYTKHLFRLEKIQKIFKELLKNDFKENVLESYLNIFNEFEEIYKEVISTK